MTQVVCDLCVCESSSSPKLANIQLDVLWSKRAVVVQRV